MNKYALEVMSKVMYTRVTLCVVLKLYHFKWLVLFLLLYFLKYNITTATFQLRPPSFMYAKTRLVSVNLMSHKNHSLSLFFRIKAIK